MWQTRLERAAPWLAGVLLVVTLSVAYVGKAVCIDEEAGFWGVTRYCYSDVRVLWSFRGFDVDAVPYAGAPAGYIEDYPFEYPPGLAFGAHAIALATETRRSFFNLHALTFAVAAGVALWQLDRALRAMGLSRTRLLGFALSPALVLFGMLNWDLWPVAFVAAGLAAATRRRPVLAGVLFGLGAATKWWPALLVPLLLVGPWARDEPDDAPEGGNAYLGDRFKPAIAAAGAWALLQLPAIVISPSGWWGAIAFHLTRPPNLDSAYAAIGTLGAYLTRWSFWGEPFADLTTWLTIGAMLLGLAHVYRRLERGDLHPGNAALALIALFLLTGKVFSPQFVLWLLPVAVVARVPWTSILAVEFTNALVWALYGPWMGSLFADPPDPRYGGFLHAAQGVTVLRSA
ncbi:MAG: glycosyltransferase 87 family protein, partial [Actinobacteria bacterium]|nr:glycosyltransferase 87 family protein [Actinomycetota bacterium]